jgi:hypothetical protein
MRRWSSFRAAVAVFLFFCVLVEFERTLKNFLLSKGRSALLAWFAVTGGFLMVKCKPASKKTGDQYSMRLDFLIVGDLRADVQADEAGRGSPKGRVRLVIIYSHLTDSPWVSGRLLAVAVNASAVFGFLTAVVAELTLTRFTWTVAALFTLAWDFSCLVLYSFAPLFK